VLDELGKVVTAFLTGRSPLLPGAAPAPGLTERGRLDNLLRAVLVNVPV
jgi:hypothetical protein